MGYGVYKCYNESHSSCKFVQKHNIIEWQVGSDPALFEGGRHSFEIKD